MFMLSFILYLKNGSTMTNFSNGTLNNGVSYGIGTVSIEYNAVLNNDGTINNDDELNNTGGTLNNTGTLTSTGTLTNDAGGTVDATTITNNGTFNFTGGTLNVDTFNGELANTGGTLGPGHSPGTTTINGDYSQDASSTLLIEIEGLIAGTEYDVLNVTGTATLDGVLDFDLDYSGLELGDSFDILSADIISGTFASITDQQINTEWVWELDYDLDLSGTDILTARVTAVPIPEPSTGLLALFGLALLPHRRRNLRRRSN
jgi:hypothetical protein